MKLVFYKQQRTIKDDSVCFLLLYSVRKLRQHRCPGGGNVQDPSTISFKRLSFTQCLALSRALLTPYFLQLNFVLNQPDLVFY